MLLNYCYELSNEQLTNTYHQSFQVLQILIWFLFLHCPKPETNYNELKCLFLCTFIVSVAVDKDSRIDTTFEACVSKPGLLCSTTGLLWQIESCFNHHETYPQRKVCSRQPHTHEWPLRTLTAQLQLIHFLFNKAQWTLCRSSGAFSPRLLS